MALRRHRERHFVNRIGWLRAAVLGANDGILSTASLMIGVAAADVSRVTVLLTGISGLVAGAMSMAAGEYVSVSSQADTEHADIAREREELAEEPEAELSELIGIWRKRGLDAETARAVADQLTAHDALEAHLRDELGISEALVAKPVQAAFASAASFGSGAILPVLTAVAFDGPALLIALGLVTVVLLAVTGALGATAGGGRPVRGAVRVMFWGVLALAVTAAIGRLFGASV